MSNRPISKPAVPLKAVLLFVLGPVFMIFGLWLIFHSTPPPSYEGRPLAFWLQEFNKSDGTVASRKRATEAIQAMGSNTLPAIMGMLRSEDSRLQQTLMNLEYRFRFIRFSLNPAAQQHLRAIFALQALGPAAQPAIPELLQLLRSKNAEIRRFAAEAVAYTGAQQEIIAPALTNALVDSNYLVRVAIEESLGSLTKQPEVAVPALMRNLDCPDAIEFREVSVALSKFRAHAKPALPLLVARLDDSSGAIRTAATNAIRAINSVPIGTTMENR